MVRAPLLSLRTLQIEDLPLVVGINASVFGMAAPSIATLEARHAVFPDLVRGIIENGSIRGYWLRFPLNTKAYLAVMNGEIINAGGFKTEHLRSTLNAAPAIYIGFAYGADRMAKAAVMAEIKETIRQAPVQKNKCLMARAGTAEGLKTLTRLGFVLGPRPTEIRVLHAHPDNIKF